MLHKPSSFNPQGLIGVASSTAFTTFITMFSSSLRASLVALVASAIVVSAAPGLTVKTSTPNLKVDGLENLKVTTTVTNSGDETLKLLNDPRGVLNPFPENSFSITDTAGSRPSFNGAKVSCASCHLTNMCLCFRPPPSGQVRPHIRCRSRRS